MTFRLPEQLMPDSVRGNFKAIERHLRDPMDSLHLRGVKQRCVIAYDEETKLLTATVDGVTKTLADWSA